MPKARIGISRVYCVKQGTGLRILQAIAMVIAISIVIPGCGNPYGSMRFLKKSEEEQRAILHKCLQRGDIHDPALMLAGVGDETSVPYLIEALGKFPPVEDESDPVICTQSHCVEALQAITNQDVGLNHDDWARWWELNEDKSREQWVADGFRERDLPVATPPDEPYVRALIREMADGHSYGARNAWTVLETVSGDLLRSQVDACSRSDDPADRLGAVATLSRMETDTAGARLAEMTKDPDAMVRESALAKANEHVRQRPVIDPNEQVIWKGSLGKEITVVGAGPDDEHVFVGYEAKQQMGQESYLAYFNLTTRNPDWSCPVSGVVNSLPVVANGRAFFCCDNGDVYCVGVPTGEVLWRKQTEGDPGHRPLNKIVLHDGAAVTTMSQFLYALDQESGEVLWQLNEAPHIGNLEFTEGQFYTSSTKNALLRVSRDGKILFRKDGEAARLLGARNGTLYATIGEYPSVLVALAGENLEELWRHDVESQVELVQSEDCLVVGFRNSRYLGIERTTGEILWSVQGHNCIPAGAFANWFVATSGRYQVELRKTATGQVTMLYDKPAVYPGQPVYMTRDFIVAGAMGAFGETDGNNLWILKVPAM
jgi:outer membrane protein assembly factor BamB